MALHLILGPANAGKTGLLNQALCEAHAGEQPLLLLPTVPDVRRAQEEYARKREAGIRPVEFDAFVDETWALWGDGRRVVGSELRKVAMRRTLEAGAHGLAETSSSGLVETMCDVASRAGLAAGACTAWAQPIALVLDDYHVRLRRMGLIERTHALDLLADDMPFSGRVIGLNRFTDLSPARERFIRALSGRNEVFAAFDWSSGSASTEALTPVVSRLTDAARSVTTAGEARFGEDDLQNLARTVFEGGCGCPPAPSLRIGLARGSEAEVLLACRAAAEAVRSGLGGVVLCFREVASRLEMLEAALEAEGLDFAIDAAVPMSMTAFGRALIALVEAGEAGERTHERMMTFLLSSYSGVSPEASAELDARWRRRRSSPSEILADAGRAQGLSELIAGAVRVRAGALGPDRALEWQKMADSLLRNGLEGSCERERRIDSAAHRAVLRVVSELSSSQEEGVSFTELWSVMSGAVVTTGSGIERPDVLVTEVSRVRGRRFDTVIIGGLDAQEFSSERPRTLVSRILDALGQPAGVEDRLIARALFHATITRARRRLVLIRKETDEKGEEVRSSTFFDEVLNVYRQANDETNEIPEGLNVMRMTLSEAVTRAPRRGRVAEPANAGPRRAAAQPISRGLLSDDEVKSALDVDREYSVSEIEAYLSCPYRWFYDRVIRPRELDAVVDVRTKGSLSHSLISRFYETWRASGRRRVTPELLDEALDLFESVSGEDSVNGECPRGPEEALALAQAHAWAREIVSSDPWYAPGLEPIHHEFRFGESEGRPVRVAGVRLKGSIDRVDSDGSAVLVTDYKSSGSVSGRRSWEREGLVQLPVYLHVAASLFGAEPVGAVYRSFQGGRPRGLWRSDGVLCECGWAENDKVDEDELREIMRAAAETVREAVDGMRAGRIEPSPRSAGSCRHCSAARVCGRSQ